MADTISTSKLSEKAVLVALSTKNQNAETTREYLDELEFLAQTLGIRTIKSFTQKLEKPDVRSYVGKGKLADIKTCVKVEKADMVIFDDDLSPS